MKRKSNAYMVPAVLLSIFCLFLIGKFLITLLYVFAGGFPESTEAFAAANRAENTGINIGEGQKTLVLSGDSTVTVTYVLQPSILAMASPAGVRLYALDASGKTVASKIVYQEPKTWQGEVTIDRNKSSSPETLVWTAQLKIPEGAQVTSAALQGGLAVATRSSYGEFSDTSEVIDERYSVTMLSQKDYDARLLLNNGRIQLKDRTLMFESFVLTPLALLPFLIAINLDTELKKKKGKGLTRRALVVCSCISGVACALAAASLIWRGPLYLDNGAFLGKVVEAIFGWFQPIITH